MKRLQERHPRWHSVLMYACAIPLFFGAIAVVPVLFAIGFSWAVPDWSFGHTDTMKTIGITFFAVATAFIAGQWFWQARK